MTRAPMPTSHHPPHIYLDNTWYAITACIVQHRRLLQPDSHKQVMRDQLKALVAEFSLTLSAWVIMDNHYHILIKPQNGADLTHAMGRWHGRTAYEINRLDQERGRQLWHNYWDTCIRTEADYWTRFNYIHNNPVKHGYTKRAEDWLYSSYRYYRERKGDEWLMDVWERYPVIDFSDPNEP